MEQPDIKQILQKVINGTATPQEEETAMYWLHYLQRQDVPALTESEIIAETDAIYQMLQQHKTPKPAGIKKLWAIVAAAASVLLIISVGGYLLLRNPAPIQTAQNQVHDVAPGSNKATLILANGNKISLGDAQNGTLAAQGNNTITKTAGGLIVYRPTAKKADTTNNAASLPAEAMNTIQIPPGGTYRLILPDGTGVWLNAASTLQYPVTFGKTQRRVVLTGEAYFEVAHNPAKPFRVVFNGQQVQVLGTHFNINAYEDEGAAKTTLLQGSVKLSLPGSSLVIKPGEQAQVANGGSSITLNQNVNTAEVVAWKNGDFVFEAQSLGSICRQVARWYNVTINCPPALQNLKFNGMVSRGKNISAVIKMIELTGKVHCQVDGRRVSIKQ